MRTTFLAVGAYLGRIESATRCAFWVEDPLDHDFDPARLVTVDLARTPRAAAAGRIPWDAVEVDDCFTATQGHIDGTTLGPRWPEIQLAGVVGIERGFWERLPSPQRPGGPIPGLPGREYEHTTAVYWPHTGDARAGKRYAGHHARIVEERGSLARVLVHPPGTSEVEGGQTFAIWLDLASPEQCDAGPRSSTDIGVGDAPKAGALFLIAGTL
jgi:hypothetical protein